MALPAQDTFNRSNGSLGSNWFSTISGLDSPQVFSNGLTSGTSYVYPYSAAYWQADSFPNDQYAQIQVANPATGNYFYGCAVRMQANGSCYAAVAYRSNSYRLYAYSPGAGATLLGSYSTAVVAGDVLNLAVAGNALTVKVNGATVITYTDSTYTSGYAGVWGSGYFSNYSGLLDNFEAAGLGSDGNASPAGMSFTSATGSPTASGTGDGSALPTGAASTSQAGLTTAGIDASASLSGTQTASSAGTLTAACVWIASPSGLAIASASGTPSANGTGKATLTGAQATSVAGSAVAFSGLVVTDNFNRADGVLGSNWSNGIGYDTVGVKSNALDPARGGVYYGWSCALWNANSFTAYHYAQIQVTTPGTSGYEYGPAVRMDGQGHGYFATVYNNQYVDLWRGDGSGVYPQLLSGFAATIHSGDTVRLEANGSILSVKLNGVVVCTATDATYANGSPGVYGQSAFDGVLDNWEGGTLAVQFVTAAPSGIVLASSAGAASVVTDSMALFYTDATFASGAGSVLAFGDSAPTATPTGVSISSAFGNPIVSVYSQVNLSGVRIASALGLPIVIVPANVTPNGAQVNSTAGAVSAYQLGYGNCPGVLASFTAGLLSVLGPATIVLNGATVASSPGMAAGKVSVIASAPGVTFTSAAGTAVGSNNIGISLNGLVITSGKGTPQSGVDNQAALTGTISYSLAGQLQATSQTMLFVQGAVLPNTPTISLPSVKAGDVILVAGFSGSTGGGVNDSQNNSYRTIASASDSNGNAICVYVTTASQNGSLTLTLSFTPKLLMVAEYAGLSASHLVDLTSVGHGSGTHAQPSLLTTAVPDELILGFCSAALGTLTPAFGYSQRLSGNYLYGQAALVDQAVYRTDDYQPGCTISSSANWVAIGLALEGTGLVATAAPSGQQAAISVGTLSLIGTANSCPDGIETDSSAGSSNAAVDVSVVIDGAEVDSSGDPVIAICDVSGLVAGLQSSSAAGTAATTADGNVVSDNAEIDSSTGEFDFEGHGLFQLLGIGSGSGAGLAGAGIGIVTAKPAGAGFTSSKGSFSETGTALVIPASNVVNALQGQFNPVCNALTTIPGVAMTSAKGIVIASSVTAQATGVETDSQCSGVSATADALTIIAGSLAQSSSGIVRGGIDNRITLTSVVMASHTGTLTWTISSKVNLLGTKSQFTAGIASFTGSAMLTLGAAPLTNSQAGISNPVIFNVVARQISSQLKTDLPVSVAVSSQPLFAVSLNSLPKVNVIASFEDDGINVQASTHLAVRVTAVIFSSSEE